MRPAKAFALLVLLGQAPAFEAASVKRNVSGETRIRFETPPGRLNAINVPLRFAIRQAYRVPESRVVGGPAWIDSDRFDIIATTPSGISDRDSVRLMLRTLLAGRFALAIHSETREMPIYSLRRARADRLGPGLRLSQTDCAGKPSNVVAGRVLCGILVSQNGGSGSLRGGGTTLAEFARLLGDFLDRPLVDDTALTGVFDLELQFSAERSALPGAPVPGGLSAVPNGDEIPSVFTALREQMGLTLESTRGPAAVLIIDRAEKPSED